MAAGKCIPRPRMQVIVPSQALHPQLPCGPDGPQCCCLVGWANNRKESRSPNPWTINTAISSWVEDIMKSWNEHDDALVAPRRAPAGIRFLTAGFVALDLIAGLDTIFPGLKQQFIPKLFSQPPSGTSHAAKSFQWSQVRVEHS